MRFITRYGRPFWFSHTFDAMFLRDKRNEDFNEVYNLNVRVVSEQWLIDTHLNNLRMDEKNYPPIQTVQSIYENRE